MDWWQALSILVGVLLVLLALGIPVVFSFWIVTMAGFFFFMQGLASFPAYITSMRSSVAVFTLTPVPFFILMGDVLFRSGIGIRMLNIMDTWLVRLPGRLSLVTVATGTILAALSGSSIGTTAMLATMLEPDMRARGYHPYMIVGPIMAAGTLAVIIPPSILTVIYGGLANVSIGKLLIAGVIPGILLAILFALYIIVACYRNPSLAPPAEVSAMTISHKLKETGLGLLPAMFLILLVMGTIFLGVCTPTEASALGAVGSFFLAAVYRKLNWKLIKDCTMSAVKTTTLALIIVTGSMAFSQLLSYIGATSEIMRVATAMPIHPMLIVIGTIVVLIIMGCFIDQISILMIGVPIFAPIVLALGYNPVWYGMLFLVAITLGYITPPFGMLYFVVKGVLPSDITMETIIRASVPYIWLFLIGIVLMLVFPPIATWLPGFM